MKAIIKATGEIATVECRWVTTIGGNDVLRFIDQKTGISYTEHQLAFLFQEDNKREPDYWTRLEHQATIGAMQGILSCPEWNIVPREGVSHAQECALQAQEFARALVEKFRNAENPKELEGLKKELEALKIEKTILENKVKLLKEERK